MSLFFRPFDAITVEDIQSLIDNQITESRHLDYKRELPESNYTEKKEFLADVSAMANSGGGDLIFGIEQNDEEPKYQLKGIKSSDIDKEKKRIESLLRDGIDPCIVHYQLKEMTIDDHKIIYLLRIHRSINAPHLVTLGGNKFFFIRNSSGRHKICVTDSRSSFLESLIHLEEARNWRLDRISKIKSNEGPVPLKNRAKLILHLIPLNYDYQVQNPDLRKLSSHISSFYGGDLHFNLDGIYGGGLKSSHLLDQFNLDIRNITYFHFFRNGQIESADERIFKYSSNNLIPGEYYENDIIQIVSLHLNFYRKVNITPPYVVGISFLGINGYSMKDPKSEAAMSISSPIKPEDLILPAVVINDFNEDLSHLLKPAFDIVWNACGLPGSINYDQEGNWIGKK